MSKARTEKTPKAGTPPAGARPPVQNRAPQSTPLVDEAILKNLPPVLRAVVRSLGFTRAKAWLAEFGGVNVNIRAGSANTLQLSPDELFLLRRALAAHLDSDDRVWLPKADKLILMVRNTHIRKERSRTSINALARRYSLSSRQIINICNEANDDRQLDLF